MMKKIAIIGVGRLGLAFALLCEKAGYEVIGCDTRADYVDQLNRKEIKTPEPQIEFLLHKSKNFTATTDINQAFKFSDLIFLFVPTPSKENGEYDHRHITEVMDALADYSASGNVAIGKTIVIGCTVMPAYCKQLQGLYEPLGIDVVYNPEFIAQGDIVKGLEQADFVLIGSTSTCDLSGLIELYSSIMIEEPNFKFMSHTFAEITKIGLNCFLVLKIAYANIIGELAIKSGEEESIDVILNAIGSDQRVGNKFFRFGFPASGVCLPRDVRALRKYMDNQGVDNVIIRELVRAGNKHMLFLSSYYVSKNPDKEVPFVFHQLSYKKGVDIITESMHLELCLMLLSIGYKVNIVESESVIEQAKPLLAQYEDRVYYGESKVGYTIDL